MYFKTFYDSDITISANMTCQNVFTYKFINILHSKHKCNDMCTHKQITTTTTTTTYYTHNIDEMY